MPRGKHAFSFNTTLGAAGWQALTSSGLLHSEELQTTSAKEPTTFSHLATDLLHETHNVYGKQLTTSDPCENDPSCIP